MLVSEAMLGAGEHFVLEVQGDSMINAGILDGDFVVIRRTDSASSGARSNSKATAARSQPASCVPGKKWSWL